MSVPSLPAGTPCWLDLSCPDPQAAASFYGELFGWELRGGDAAETPGDRRRFLLDQVAVASVHTPALGGRPGTWTLHLAAANPDTSITRAVAAGARIAVRAHDVTGLGRLATLRDPGGAAVGVIGPGSDGPGPVSTPTGPDGPARPGALAWAELMTRDYLACRDFYAGVFGLRVHARDAAVPWSQLHTADGALVGGMGEIDPSFPDSIPAHWMPYLAVTQLETALVAALSLGAQLLAGPMPGVAGQVGLLQGPQGERFGLIVPHN